MPAKSDFVEHLVDMLEPIGPVQARSMFGGFGLFRNGLMFALISDDTLYFKVDKHNLPDFEARDLGPFVYQKKGKDFTIAYHQAPPESLEDANKLCRWADRAFEAAVRAAKNKSRKMPKR